MSTTKQPRMVKLQINSSGAWRDVLRFDIDEHDVEAIQAAAVNLVVLADALQTALIRWDAKRGWVEA